MRFFKAISSGFANYVKIEGVASRSEFWFWLLFCILLLCITLIVDGAYFGPLIGNLNGNEVMAFDQDVPKWLSLITLILLLPPTFTAAIRRLNDIGFSKFWIGLAFTIIGILPLLLLLLKKRKKTSAI